MKLHIQIFALCSLFFANTLMAQSGGLEDYGGNNGGNNAGYDNNYDSNEALEEATPTDNVNELDSNSGDYSLGGNVNNSDSSNDYPANQNQGNFNINNGNNYGDSLFENENSEEKIPGLDNNEQSAGPNALGNGNSNIPANTTVQQIEPQQAPDADQLMNEIEQPVNNGNQNTPNYQGAEPNGLEADNPEQDKELVVLDEPEGPLAPPLPPPNEFAGTPPVPGSMRQMAEGEAPEIYMVEHGDTLFDICDQLLDEPSYWPKLWAMNPSIKNPHFIFPGVALKFYPGDDESPPYLQVVSEEDIIPIDKGDLDESELISEIVKLPTEAFQDNAIEVIGPDGVQDELFSDSFETAGKSFSGSDIVVRVPLFLYSTEKEPLAFVLGGRNGEHTVVDLRVALVETTNAGVTSGSTYTILRPHGEVENPETGELAGYKYSYVANITMGETIEDGVFTGVVKDTRTSVFPNDILVSYTSTIRTIPHGYDVGSLGESNANIVGFEYPDQMMGAEGQMALIDKGNSDGISAGMYLPIFSSPSAALTISNRLPEDYRQIGVIRIINATDAGATGYIVKNSLEMRVGDRAGKG